MAVEVLAWEMERGRDAYIRQLGASAGLKRLGGRPTDIVSRRDVLNDRAPRGDKATWTQNNTLDQGTTSSKMAAVSDADIP